jgi:hypothetical protein
VRSPLLALLALAVLAAAPAADARPAPLPVEQRLLRGGELARFVPLPAATRLVTRDPRAWVAATRPAHVDAELARLRRLGFVAAARRRLTAPSLPLRDAVSTAVQLRSPGAARAEAAHAASQYPRARRFGLTGIPGAHVFVTTRRDSTNVAAVFADGRYAYVIEAVRPRKTRRPARAELTAAARRLYARVHGHPPGATRRASRAAAR